ncbi:hypothetical protein A2954_05690 [Candidatus Roizmanbacteria bacterium RIFCSPLOWO2_01_FULL_37_12]|uniref:Uncharacterized protein n=1 Tax=Candidatus Roizmanbacteria bacterium RIFCSPLOWO2_01_FULL_37_12 TaxID=1802056 RepID=A0A1F7IBR3_9BACT|nr:MAG: hypothetical protein A2768_02430 [Candidatus Roizmanbacteria bacterium RIFCSPHIGHO2_01_FULL_37_16]OGK25966.1 MAG: hypothetical protein A3D76_03305 [Candidatus Roizmanbacteria bacterium RIFCSPHIGHO2_02_FULL_37_9b]OGK40801.1 MAG: hypothetical protein A2954_05690 [Candidatus Roizmanbacteria bacterium RIFCSPLOWO2_01_FULL_37_12]
MKILSYRTIIQRDGKRYHGFVPMLPGCHTDGKTIEETRKNLKEVIKLWIETSESMGWKIPVDESVESIESVELDNDLDKNLLSYA